MSGLEISSFVHLGWKKGKRAEARFLFLGVSRLKYSFLSKSHRVLRLR